MPKSIPYSQTLQLPMKYKVRPVIADARATEPADARKNSLAASMFLWRRYSLASRITVSTSAKSFSRIWR